MNAVITGDLIHFTELEKNDKIKLLEEIESVFKTWSKDFEMEYEIYRGDSFQCYMRSPNQSLRLALIIKTFIKSLNSSEEGHISRATKGKRKMIFTVLEFDTRISIGIGGNNFRTSTLAKSNGDAFVLSGRSLDALKNKKQTIGIATNDYNIGELTTEIELLDFIIQRTTALQCEVLYLKLLGYNETEIANMLEVNQSAINQRSMNAGWNQINTLVERFEELYP